MIGTVGLMFICLLNDLIPAHFAMIAALAVVMFAQVVNTEEVSFFTVRVAH